MQGYAASHQTALRRCSGIMWRQLAFVALILVRLQMQMLQAPVHSYRTSSRNLHVSPTVTL